MLRRWIASIIARPWIGSSPFLKICLNVCNFSAYPAVSESSCKSKKTVPLTLSFHKAIKANYYLKKVEKNDKHFVKNSLINAVTSAKSIYIYNYIIVSYGVLFCGTKSQCFLWNAPFLSARKGRLKFFEDGLHPFCISVLRKWPARSSCQGNTARQRHWEREREREWLCSSPLRDFKLRHDL